MKALSKLQLNFSPTSPSDAVNKEYVDRKVDNAHLYHYCGTISSYDDLPTNNLKVGMTYNIENPDSEHGVKRGDNLAWDGDKWDNLAGYVDLSLFYTKDEIDAIISSNIGSIYLGEIELSNNRLNIEIPELSSDDINTHIILILKSMSSSTSVSVVNSSVTINSENTSFQIVDKFENPIRICDVINGGNITLCFNGTDFILLNKEYLLDSYQSDSIAFAPTAHALKQVYDHFESVIGNIPEVLDSINRVVI